MNKVISLIAVSVLLFPAVSFASVNITVNGANPDVSHAGVNYTDPGVSAVSTVDGDVSGNVNYTDTNTNNGFERNYSVTDSALDSANASRDVIFISSGGGSMPFCSGPLAPGWHVDLPNGGCDVQQTTGALPGVSIQNTDGSWTLKAVGF